MQIIHGEAAGVSENNFDLIAANIQEDVLNNISDKFKSKTVKNYLLL